MPKPNIKKTVTTHPRSQREMKMDDVIYTPFKKAIMESLKGSKGKTFAELTKEVTNIIKKKMPAFKKSIPWYTISIRLDLETKGIVGLLSLTVFTFSKNGFIIGSIIGEWNACDVTNIFATISLVSKSF